MDLLPQDLRYALRSLRKTPAFTAVALVSLALGVGANSAIFTLMDQVLLRSLPVKDPGGLVLVKDSAPRMGRVNGTDSFSYPMYVNLRDANTVFTGMLADCPADLSMSYRGKTERVHGDIVTGDYFDVLGVRAALGRVLTPEDDIHPGAHPVVVLSYGYWQRRFGGDRNLLNQVIRINGNPMTVLGVARGGFRGTTADAPVDVFVPMMMKAQMTPGEDGLSDPRMYLFNVIGRLKPGISMRQAEIALTTLWRPYLERDLATMPARSAYFRTRFLKKQVILAPGSKGLSQLRQQFSAPLIVLMSMVGLVLLIACANVANLLVARAASRQKEVAVRLALGASRYRIMRQLVVESLTLAAGGGVLGLLVGAWTTSLILRLLPFEGAAETFRSDPDLRVTVFTFAVALATGLLFGLIPAIQATKPQLAGTLKDQAANVSAVGGQVRIRKLLVVAQVALSLLLLIGAGLFARSLYNLRTLSPGFETEHLVSFSVDPSLLGYTQAQLRVFYSNLRNSIAAQPGIRSVSLAGVPIMHGNVAMMSVIIEGYHPKDGEDMAPQVNWVGPRYLETIGIPIVAGRDVTEADLGSYRTAVINEKMAHYFFGNANPIGRHIGFGGPDAKTDVEIVGLVKDTKENSFRDPALRFVYLPYSQDRNLTGMTFYVRTMQDPAAVENQLRRAVAKLDSNLPVFEMRTMETQINESLFIDRLIALLSALFGLLATGLAAVGLYGVMAYAVTRRTREIGLRMALGAGRGDVVWLVMREVTAMAMVGIAIALPLAIALSHLIRSQLFGLEPTDPATLLLATMLLATVAVVAGYLPAMRATRVDPITALRYE